MISQHFGEATHQQEWVPSKDECMLLLRFEFGDAMSLINYFYPKRTIVSGLAGGLGNQMFQYAAGRALASEFRWDLVLDTRLLHTQGSHTHRDYALDAYKVRAGVDGVPISRLEGMRVLSEGEAHRGWPRRRKVKADLLLSGHWQSERYFLPIRKTLLKDFALANEPSAYVGELAQRIRLSPNAVSVHFRRGDYVSNPNAASFHGTCSIAYYHEAVRRLDQKVGKSDLYIFSDDPEWVRSEVNLPGVFTVVDCERSTPAEDIWLMSLCRHHIIANSSFSWWGAWLGEWAGLTIAPSTWFLDQSAAQSHIVPERWERI